MSYIAKPCHRGTFYAPVYILLFLFSLVYVWDANLLFTCIFLRVFVCEIHDDVLHGFGFCVACCA